MANTKNKHSSKIHSRTRFLSNSQNPTRKALLAIIILVILAVIISIISTFAFSPEHITKSTISNLANEYYEEYFYPTISKENISKTMANYTNTGFNKVTLRQLLLYQPQNTKYEDALLEYCDENTTYVIFYPKSPFTKTDYHTKFIYSCSF